MLVGRKIRKLRKERRLEQAAVAARLGLQPADLARIEKGEYRISLDLLFTLLAVFGASLADLVEDGSGPLMRREPGTAREP